MSTIQYKGVNLARGSEAAELLDKKEFVKLDELLRNLEQKRIKLPPELVNYRIGEHPGDWK